jgi:hypothetical protein
VELNFHIDNFSTCLESKVLFTTTEMFAQFLPSFLLLTLATAQGFSGYPSAALSCLQAANANSGCNTESTDTLFNQCVCSNTGGSITNFTICLTQTDPADIESSYNTYAENCASTGTPMSMSLQDFIATGKQGSGSSRECNSESIGLSYR